VRLTTNSLIDANPTWSPDGTKLAFERCCENGTSDLFTIDVATRAEVNVTATAGQEFDPAWSPDGTRIAFVAFEVGQGNIDIWVMNADGTAPMRLTQEAGPDLSPHWQPIPA
jgi:TolB protein